MKNKCKCVYATSKNTPSVRTGHEMGGYLKKKCKECEDKTQKIIPSTKIKTVSGYYFDFTRIGQYDYDPIDIGKALSKICRFGGHCEQFYSVAQHSVLVSRLVPEEYALAGLFHDASEAFMGDMVSPLKGLMPEFQNLEIRIQRIIFEQLGIQWTMDMLDEVKKADLIALRTEQRDIVGAEDDIWAVTRDYKPIKRRINPLSHEAAFLSFKSRYRDLRYAQLSKGKSKNNTD